MPMRGTTNPDPESPMSHQTIPDDPSVPDVSEWLIVEDEESAQD
jgi:hypothetical protein